MATEFAPYSEPETRSPKEAQIVEAARRLFLEQGYEITSMDAIAAEANVSKRTVYSHFRSKELLFVEVMEGMCAQFGVGDREAIDPADAPERYLCSVAKFLLSKVLDPRMHSVTRTIAAESASFPEMGQRFWAIGPGKLVQEVTEYLARQHEAGALSVPDPRLSAGMFQSMVAGPIFLPTLFTGEAPYTEADRDRIAREATRMFLAAHRPTQG
ncbi:TetR/AcrR family transcriptional regulator [Thalassobaculum sp.]|uniref:TetR/AcrR family transcriptional regulator n=1 Tax=Thalassobaculum sp. TaxID=2022740 RepID=UPI0032EDBC83